MGRSLERVVSLKTRRNFFSRGIRETESGCKRIWNLVTYCSYDFVEVANSYGQFAVNKIGITVNCSVSSMSNSAYPTVIKIISALAGLDIHTS